MSTAAVNSALQRARATLASRNVTMPRDSLSDEQSELLDRYVDAFHRYDVDDLVALLREDATLSMPPYTLWLQGPDTIKAWLRRARRRVPRLASGGHRGVRRPGLRAVSRQRAQRRVSTPGHSSSSRSRTAASPHGTRSWIPRRCSPALAFRFASPLAELRAKNEERNSERRIERRTQTVSPGTTCSVRCSIALSSILSPSSSFSFFVPAGRWFCGRPAV